MHVGQKITHYTLVDKIGEGGFGDVFLAKDDNTGMEVAIKCSRPLDDNRLKDCQARFLREVSCISKLRHPGIVQLFDYGSLDDGTLYLVMEYVCGLNLEVLIKRDAPYSYIFASDIILQVLDALSEAHAQGIVHRDLKPANIMLVRQGLRHDVVKLLDFGIAKAFNGTEPDLTRQTFEKGAGFGTPQYMPPEQFYGKSVGPYSDLYAVGLLFYELLTGKQAVTGKTLFEVVEKQLKVFPDIPSPFNQGPLFDIFRRALAKQVSMRYASAAEMYADIDAIVRQGSPFLPLYSSAAGHQGERFSVSVVKAAASVNGIMPESQDSGSGEFFDDDEASTIDTMAFNHDQSHPYPGDVDVEDEDDADVSACNTMIFDSDDRSSVGHADAPQSLYDEIDDMSPTDDMSRVDPSITLPKGAKTVPNAQNHGETFVLDLPSSSSRSSTFPLRQAENLKTEDFRVDPNMSEAATCMIDAYPSEEMQISTSAMSAHPELANIPMGSVSPVPSHANMDEAKTFMVSPDQLPPEDDLPPVFHQQKTQFISRRQMQMRRPTLYYGRTPLGRVYGAILGSSLCMKVMASKPVSKLREWSLRLSGFIDTLYEDHFLGLVAGVCLVILVLMVLLAVMLFT